MIISSKQDFIEQVRRFNIDTEYVVVKPNWVSNEFGEYTEAEILDWLFEALPQQKKIVIESYTPWRGSKFFQEHKKDRSVVSLDGGKKYWDQYKEQDQEFLISTGIQSVLAKHSADYINITNEVWSENCVSPKDIEKLVNTPVKWQEFYSYIPQKLYDIRDRSTLISLSKIKIESSIPAIQISMSIKNIFGLIPHPSRWEPFHEEDHALIPEVIHDIFTVYNSIFNKSFWITEGIKTLVVNYCDPEQKIIENKNLLFIDHDPKKVDEEASLEMGLDPGIIPQLKLII